MFHERLSLAMAQGRALASRLSRQSVLYVSMVICVKSAAYNGRAQWHSCPPYHGGRGSTPWSRGKEGGNRLALLKRQCPIADYFMTDPDFTLIAVSEKH
jgi:hypothetical protein